MVQLARLVALTTFPYRCHERREAEAGCRGKPARWSAQGGADRRRIIFWTPLDWTGTPSANSACTARASVSHSCLLRPDFQSFCLTHGVTEPYGTQLRSISVAMRTRARPLA